ncbi:hypothetical protein HYH03_011725 [Edaphochlamys debaryana]|uniref:Protein SCAI n=1 Tax=Edaphochlamys debaryana TaxID=47281 RepID=A0A836BW61_9CHLO|nr:hypothetical protein HYH03_011725 [Edaphochlamys debaryana]|eukprot:KAG2489774.1 hypothetical protein HYH03_011725 [Edaphochlamys debaryana]
MALTSPQFRSFSRLWAFQLTHRPALLETGLQRSDLGGIASKIGQLYYNFYLRSGDTGALLESYTFYDAIHTRAYFGQSAADAPDPLSAARQLRFYARFVVVCLLLERKEEAMQLLQELQASVSAYVLQFSPPDAADWQLVVNEVAALMAADVAMPLPRAPGLLEAPFKPALRCRPWGPSASCAPHRSRLREAVLVSYRQRQVKVAELPLELYRMAQALEWHDPRLGAEAGASDSERSSAAPTSRDGPDSAGPSGLSPGSRGTSASSSAAVPGPGPTASTGAPAAVAGGVAGAGASSSSSSAHRNPPRVLLHRPSAQQLLCSLLSVTSALPPGDDFVLCYIAADTAPRQPTAAAGSAAAAAAGGAAGSGERQLLLSPAPHAAAQGHGHHRAGSEGPAAAAGGAGGKGGGSVAAPAALTDGLLAPEELLSATRRRLLLVVDSNMAPDFLRLRGRERGCPLLALLSPSAPPPGPLSDPCRYGCLTTMALACPAQALCVMAGEADPPPATLQRLQDVLDDVMLNLGRHMAEQLAEAQAEAPGSSGAAGGGGGAGAPEYAAWGPAFADALSRRLLLHFALYRACMTALHQTNGRADGNHDGGSAQALLPSCFPPLPPAADADSAELRAGVLRAAEVLGRQAVFGGGGAGALANDVATQLRLDA